MAKYLIEGLEEEIEDSAKLDYLKFNNLRRTVLGCMMGDFNEQGKYVVEPNIIKELIQLPKYIVDSVGQIDICNSELKLDKQLSFMVSCEENRAVLLLVEKLNYDANFKTNAGGYGKVQEFVLDEVKTSGLVDRNLLYTRWNVNLFGGKVVDVFNNAEISQKYPNIVNRFKYLLKSNKIFLENEEKLENIEEEFTTMLLEIISHYPELKKAVELKVKDEINSNKTLLLVDRPYFAKTLNEILGKVIRDDINILSKDQQKNFNDELHNLFVLINVKRTDIIDVKRKTIKDINDLDIKDILLALEVGDLTEEDLMAIANEYVMFLKNGKINPRFKLIDYLISIGVIKTNIGLKNEEKENLVVAGAKKEEQKKKEQKTEKKDDKKKDKGKAKAKDKKKDKKKEVKKKDDKKKGDKKKDDKNKKNNLVAKTIKKKKIYFYAAPNVNTQIRSNNNLSASNVQNGLLATISNARAVHTKTENKTVSKVKSVRTVVVEEIETSTEV